MKKRKSCKQARHVNAKRQRAEPASAGEHKAESASAGEHKADEQSLYPFMGHTLWATFWYIGASLPLNRHERVLQTLRVQVQLNTVHPDSIPGEEVAVVRCPRPYCFHLRCPLDHWEAYFTRGEEKIPGVERGVFDILAGDTNKPNMPWLITDASFPRFDPENLHLRSLKYNHFSNSLPGIPRTSWSAWISHGSVLVIIEQNELREHTQRIQTLSTCIPFLPKSLVNIIVCFDA